MSDIDYAMTVKGLLADLPTLLERTVVTIKWQRHGTEEVEGTIEVDGYVSEQFPGLAVTATVLEFTGDLIWSTTHLESGRSIGLPGNRLETNLLVAVRAAQMCDWTRVHYGNGTTRHEDVADLKGAVAGLHAYATQVFALLETDPDDFDDDLDEEP